MGTIKSFLILIEDTKPGDHVMVMITKTELLNVEDETIT